MKVHHFNEFRFIRDNRPDIRYAICVILPGGCMGLSINSIVDGPDEYSKKDFQKLTRYNRVKIINYSDLFKGISGIRGFLTRNTLWMYDIFIIDFYK